jgi:hypothetical protein
MRLPGRPPPSPEALFTTNAFALHAYMADVKTFRGQRTDM